MSSRPPDLRVDLWIPLASEGGSRRTAALSGITWRTVIRPDMGNDAAFEFDGVDSLAPGERCPARVTFVMPELLEQRVVVGGEYIVGDQTRCEARFRVLDVLRPELEAHDQ